MSGFLTIQSILQIAQISEYLAIVDIAKNNIFSGADISENQARLIYMERVGIQNRYNLNPSDPTLQGAANYLLSICRQQAPQAQTIQNNLGGTKPIITGPANQSVLVGQTATFSVSVASATPVSYIWFLNGVAIPNSNSPSYQVVNATLAQSGGLYSVMATNSAGSVTSNQATLTVTALLQGSWYAGAVDYSAQLLAGNDVVPWSGTFNYTAGQPLVVQFPSGQVLYIAIKYPTSETLKTHYANPTGGLDQGTIPGLALETNVFNVQNFIFSRSGNQFGINNTNGQITFS